MLSARLCIAIVVSLLSLLAPGVAEAALYLTPQGSDSEPCMRNLPCRSLERADQLVAPGTTVYVAPGDYAPARLRRSGRPTARIRYRSTTPWGARITGESGAAVLVSGRYVDFAGFDVTGTADVTSGIALTGSYSRAIGNRVHDIPRRCQDNGGIVAADDRYRAHDIEIIGNWVHDIGSGPRDGSCHLLHGIYAAVPGVRIVNNVVARALADGITSWHAATRLTVVNNTVVGNGGDGILIGNGDRGGTREGNTRSYVANNLLASNVGDAISEGGAHPIFNTYRANTYAGNGRDRLDQWGASKEQATSTAAPGFTNATDDDYRLLHASAAAGSGTRRGAPARDFDGSRRAPGGVSRGAYEEQHGPAAARVPGSPGTWPALSAAAASSRPPTLFTGGGTPAR